MASADQQSSQQQIIQAVLDVVEQALKVSVIGTIPVTLPDPLPVSFSGGTQAVEIRASDGDSVSINDKFTDNSAEVVNRRLQVDADATGTFTIPPSTDFEAQTVTVTTSAVPLSFSTLSTISAITVKAPVTNDGPIWVGKANVLTAMYELNVGESVTLPVYAGAIVYLARAVGAGTFEATCVAVN